MKNYGLILDEIQPEDYTFGASLPMTIVQESGQWDFFLPDPERQMIKTETQACTSFGTLSALEILLKKMGVEINYSDRWSAWNSGTDPYAGNSPHRVAETLRKSGVPIQPKWDFTDDIDTPEKFYANPPVKLIDDAKKDFLDKYDFKHEYVGTSVEVLKSALQSSPLGIAVSAWSERDGIFYSNGMPNNHWCVLYGYDDEKKAWKVFDSYDNFTKLYSYDSLISQAKRYYIKKKEEPKGLSQVIIDFIYSWTGILLYQDGTRVEPVEPPKPKPMSKLLELAKANLGKDVSPKDLVSDNFGCAESLSTLVRQIVPNFPIVTGTWTLYDLLRTHKSFERVTEPEAGDIILCVTGMGKGTIANGHAGIISNNGFIMSNQSANGLWLENFTQNSWKERYVIAGKYPVFYYRLKADITG